jgi:aspartyl-tRNA(Asn)/glutamyl-tRNA(Gln) amidotransferase subunit B
MAMADWEVVIGLECHVQLRTASKLFSPAPNRYGDPSNENVDVVDAGLPGVLPVLNDKAVDGALRLGLAIGSDIRRTNVFARKHYFYPDLPKGYQISQFDEPICEGGSLVVDVDGDEREIGVTRIHMEEDAGKSLHDAHSNASFVDYNRAGTPLLEVVSEPDMRSAEEATAYLRALRTLVMYLGICDGNMQEGSLRADANVSVRKKGSTELGTRTEMKNLNSARFLGQAIEAEARRQVRLIEDGAEVVQETRLWDSDKRESRSMRGKEEAHDYRYFPDPDLLPVVIEEAEIEALKAELPELPRAKRQRFADVLGLPDDDARLLVSDQSLASYFEAALAEHDNPRGVANRVLNDVLRTAKERAGEDEEASIDAAGIPPRAIGRLVKLVDDKVITGKIAKQVYAELEATGADDPAAIVEEKGWKVERDEGALAAMIDDLIANNDKQVVQYKAGKAKVLGFFVGQVMKQTKGQADPADVNRLLKDKLGEPGEG